MKNGYAAILKAGDYTIGRTHEKGTKYYSSDGKTPQLILAEHVIRLANLSAVRWSDHPQVQKSLARGIWKNARNAAIKRGENVEKWEADNPLEAYLGKKVPAPTSIGITPDEQSLMSAFNTQTEETDDRTMHAVDVVEEADISAEELAALEKRFIQLNYKDLESFAERNGVDYDALVEGGAQDWIERKAAKRNKK